MLERDTSVNSVRTDRKNEQPMKNQYFLQLGEIYSTRIQKIILKSFRIIYNLQYSKTTIFSESVWTKSRRRIINYNLPSGRAVD